MKKYTLWSVIILILIVGGWYIFNTSKPMESGDNSITKIGVIVPLTGPLAEYGVAYKNGIVLASEKYGNKKIQYIFEDSAYEPKKAVAAFYKLKDIDKVNVLMNWGGVPTEAVNPLLKDQKLPYLVGSTLAHATESSPYTIRVFDAPDDFGRSMWLYFRAHSIKKLAIIKDERVYFNSLVDTLNATKNSDESVNVIETYTSFDEKNFHTPILKVKKDSSKYDIVGVFLATGQIREFYKQAKELDLKTPTFGTDFFESQSEIDAAGKSINGAVFANYNVSDSFKTEYTARFGNVSQISYAGNGFDIASMLNNIDLTSNDSIIKDFKAMKNFNGVLGNYHYIETSNDRYLFSPVRMKVIEDGVIKPVE